MKTSFLMVNYNDYENVNKLIKQIENYSIIDRIVIVDNCSTDNSLHMLKQLESEKVVVLESNHNGGYGYGINIGARYLNENNKDGIIVVSNTDLIISCEEDIQTLVNTFKEDTAVVAPMIKEHTGYNVGWRVPNPWQDLLLSIPGIYKRYQKKMQYSIDEIQNNIKEVEAVSGCFFLIRSSVLEKVEYFDENVFLYYEENILSQKLKKINQKVVINGNIEVFHNHSVTINRVHTSVQKYKNLKKSQYYFQTHYNHAGIINRLMMKILFGVVCFGMKIRQYKWMYNITLLILL